MFVYDCVVILMVVLTVNGDQPDVEMYSGSVSDDTKMVLACRAKGFNTSGIELHIKKNRCDLLTEEDGLESSGVHQHTDTTYWRRDYIIISKSEMSNYSCEVIHAESRFHVEKVWDPECEGVGQIISSKFVNLSKTSPPHVVVSVDDKEQANITLTCQAKDFYPRDITVNIKRNGNILTREDGVKTSGVCLSKNNTFQRTDSIVISKSDISKYSVEVNHNASGYHAEKVWAGIGDSGDKPDITAAKIVVLVLVLVLFLVLLLVRYGKRILGAARQITAKYSVNSTPPPVGNAAPPPESKESRGSQRSLEYPINFTNSASDESGFDESDRDDTSNKAETEKLLKTNVQDQSTPSEPSDSSTRE